MSTTRPYKLDRVSIRMVKEPPLDSGDPFPSGGADCLPRLSRDGLRPV